MKISALLLTLAWAMASTPPLAARTTVGAVPVRSRRQTVKERTSTMKIRLTINGKAINATLIDNATARDFLTLLPMTLMLEDYAATEKISYLPRKLSTAGAPAGSDPSVGDVTYYAPWGNLAFFYRDFRYSTGLIQLGRIDSGIQALSVAGPLKATIERIEK